MRSNLAARLNPHNLLPISIVPSEWKWRTTPCLKSFTRTIIFKRQCLRDLLRFCAVFQWSVESLACKFALTFAFGPRPLSPLQRGAQGSRLGSTIIVANEKLDRRGKRRSRRGAARFCQQRPFLCKTIEWHSNIGIVQEIARASDKKMPMVFGTKRPSRVGKLAKI